MVGNSEVHSEKAGYEATIFCARTPTLKNGNLLLGIGVKPNLVPLFVVWVTYAQTLCFGIEACRRELNAFGKQLCQSVRA